MKKNNLFFILVFRCNIVLIVSLYITTFLFSTRAKSPGGAAGTAHGTSHRIKTLVTGPKPKAETEQF